MAFAKLALGYTEKEFTIFEKMKAADGIILASPVYSANISSHMQALLERAAVVCDMNSSLMKHKVGASVVAARRRVKRRGRHEPFLP